MSLDFYDTDADPAVYEDLAEIAEERDRYAAEARQARKALAAANTVITEQSVAIADLRQQLHAAGMSPTGARWQIGRAA